MSRTCKELEIAAEVDKLPEVLSFIEQQLEEAGCPLKTQMQISIAAEEIFVNIASYAYASGTGTAVIYVECCENPAAVVLSFLDSGIPFDPLAKEDPDVSLPAEEREIGGLGIFMARKIMDDLHYEYRDGRNILTITKML